MSAERDEFIETIIGIIKANPDVEAKIKEVFFDPLTIVPPPSPSIIPSKSCDEESEKEKNSCTIRDLQSVATEILMKADGTAIPQVIMPSCCLPSNFRPKWIFETEDDDEDSDGEEESVEDGDEEGGDKEEGEKEEGGKEGDDEDEEVEVVTKKSKPLAEVEDESESEKDEAEEFCSCIVELPQPPIVLGCAPYPGMKRPPSVCYKIIQTIKVYK